MTAPRPPDWKKTLADLTEEMAQRIRFPDPDEIEWARDYERSLLPAGTIFPRSGQVWEAVDDCDVLVSLWFAAPASGSEKGRLAKGERVGILEGGPGKAYRRQFPAN